MTIKRLFLALTAVAMSMAGFSAQAIEGPVLIFGGTSGTGLAMAQVLRAQDVPVTVFVRPTSDLSGLEPIGVSTVVGDALNAEDVNAAFASGKFESVISSLGGRRGEPRPDFEGNKNITAAAKAAGVKRVIQVSSIGAGETREPPAEGAHFMAEVLYVKTLAEDDLMASGADYTIIRPGGLRRGEATGTGILTGEERMGSIDRQELGRLVVDALGDPSAIGKILYALDPALPVPDLERD